MKADDSKTMIANLFQTVQSRIQRGSFLKRLLSLVLALLVFGFLGYRALQGIRQLDGAQLSFNPGFLFLSFLCQFIGVLLAAWIWSDILTRLGQKSRYLFDLETFTATAIARKIPGTLWYAVGRVAVYNAAGFAKSRVILAIAIEAVVIALGGLVNLAASLGMHAFDIPGLEGPLFSPQITAFVLIPGVLIISSILSPKLIHFMLKRTGSRNEHPSGVNNISYVDTMRWIIGEALVVLLATGVGFFLMKSMNVASVISNASSTVPFTTLLGPVSLAVVIGPLAMWLPGDIGLKDGFLYMSLTPWTSGSLAALITLSWRLWLSLLEISMGLLGWALLQKKIKILKDRKIYD